jgi:uncharacterized spore protein YtfJ
MAGEGEGGRQGPYRVEVVRGEPYGVGGRTLIPEAQITSFGRGRGTIGEQGITGWGAGLVQVKPLALIELTEAGEQRTAITNSTASTLRVLLGTALAMTLAFAAVRCLVRRQRRATVEDRA